MSSSDFLARMSDRVGQTTTASPTQTSMAQTIALLQQEIDVLKAELEKAPKAEASLSQTKRDLIAAIPRIDDRLARSLLKAILDEFPLANESQDRRRG